MQADANTTAPGSAKKSKPEDDIDVEAAAKNNLVGEHASDDGDDCSLYSSS